MIHPIHTTQIEMLAASCVKHAQRHFHTARAHERDGFYVLAEDSYTKSWYQLILAVATKSGDLPV